MLKIALFGPPGAGKGTQSKMLIERYNLTYISTGDMLRQEIAEGTEIGMKAKGIIEKGGLAPDELIVQMIEKLIQDKPKSNGFLFDGFPRTVVQAYILEGLLQKMHTSLTCMLSLEVPREELLNRLTERSKVSGRADDQDMAIIRYRLDEYDNKTIPVAAFYNDQQKYCPIDGVGQLSDIYKRLTEAISASRKEEWLNIVLLGLPGSGKGSQSELFAKKYNLVHIATGDMLRNEIAQQTELGVRAKESMDSGRLVPDDIVIRLIERKIMLSPDANGFLFDGFPANLVQAYILDGLLRKHNSSVSAVYYLDVPSLQAMKRLMSRGKSEKARSYDLDAEVIIRRIEQYEQTSRSVTEFYGNQSKICRIDANGSIEDVFGILNTHIEQFIDYNDITLKNLK